MVSCVIHGEACWSQTPVFCVCDLCVLCLLFRELCVSHLVSYVLYVLNLLSCVFRVLCGGSRVFSSFPCVSWTIWTSLWSAMCVICSVPCSVLNMQCPVFRVLYEVSCVLRGLGSSSRAPVQLLQSSSHSCCQPCLPSASTIWPAVSDAGIGEILWHHSLHVFCCDLGRTVISLVRLDVELGVTLAPVQKELITGSFAPPWLLGISSKRVDQSPDHLRLFLNVDFK